MQVNYSEHAAAALKLTTHEVRRLSDVVVRSEHLLLALTQSTTDDLLQVAGINRASVIERIQQRLIKQRPDTEFVLTPGCQTPRVKQAILSSQQRATMESREVELRDIWYSLLQDEACVEILREEGLDVVRLAQELG